MARVLLRASDHDGSRRLTGGDLEVFESLRALDDEWMIAVKPTFGVNAPDFVALHGEFGVCALSVRDWSVGAFRQACDGSIEVHGERGWHPTGERPRSEALEQRNAIFTGFFADAVDTAPDTVVRAVVVMPKYTTADACNLLRRPQLVNAENWVDVWGGIEFRQHAAWALTGDPRMRRKRVPRRAFDRLLSHMQDESTLQPA